MSDDKVPTSAVARPGYFQQYLSRMAPTPLPPPPLPLPASSSKPALPAPLSSNRRAGAKELGHKHAKAPPRKSLVDAFKQHGMKLCDGSKLNAVSKGVTHLGAIPPTLGIHITALYLSQNELRGLDGIEQFKNVRLLSVAANRLSRFSDLERLQELPQLRHLNVMGNPLCDHPNYRFRVIDTVRTLVVLDTIEISKQERALAPLVASQDRALRVMVMKNHMEIQKLQHAASWIRVLGELHCGVLRDAVTGRFDQLPSPHSDSVINLDRFLRMWRYEDSFTTRERDVLESQMMAIVARTRSKLTEERPQTKAKELLFKLANASALRRGNLNEMSPPIRREHCVWEDAYAQVLQLQQQTIANLRSECDRNRQGMLDSMRELVVVNPAQRRALAMRRDGSPRRHSITSRSQQRASLHSNRDAATETAPIDCDRQLPQRSPLEPIAGEQSNGCFSASCMVPSSKQPLRPPNGPVVVENRSARPSQLSLRRVLRSGEFGNKTLNEAIENFALREPAAPKLIDRRRIDRTNSTVLQAHASGFSFIPENDIAERSVKPAESSRFSSTRSHSSYPSYSLRQSNFSGDPASPRTLPRPTGTETVCSADTLYAPSVDGFSSECCESDTLSIEPNVVTSHARHSRSQDEILHQREMKPHELNTVYEEDPFSGNRRQAKEHDKHQAPGTPNTSVPLPRYLDERQHELEAREEKYITALMESEQREVDLRHQIGVMNKQLAHFQQLVSKNEDERQRMKREIKERTTAIARPTLLRRFFVKWVHHQYWSLHLRHLQRKRRFVIQHDAFWHWRRQIWARQQLRRIQRRQHMRLQRSHLTEWANLTRISVIALHTHVLRQSQLMKRVLDEWRQQIHVQKLTSHMLESRRQDSSHQQKAATFRAWRRVTSQARQLRQLQAIYGRGTLRALKRSVLSNWKVYMVTVARPQRIKVAEFAASMTLSSMKGHLWAWRRVTKSDRFYRSHLQQKICYAWRSSIRQNVVERDRMKGVRADMLKIHLFEWRQIATERSTRRRSLSILSRQMNHRRVRKLWMYWKIYSIARKRYMQGASKARKHYYKKLLRRTWTQWKREAQANLVSMKNKKRSELRYHFTALRVGVHKQQEDKKRQLLAAHAAKRQLFATLRQAFTAWARCTKRRRRCSTLRLFLQCNRTRNLIGFAWSRWKFQSLLRLRHKFVQSRHHMQIEAEEKKETERELNVLNDRSVSLTEQVRRLTSQVRGQAKDLLAYREVLDQREQQIDELEKEVADATQMLEQADSDRKDANHRAQADQKRHQSRARELEDECRMLKSRTDELQGTVQNLSRQLHEASEQQSSLQKRLTESHGQREELQRTKDAQEQALRANIGDLNRRLQEEQVEREETVRRLTEYEARIATTCAEISDHENAHEEECIKLRAENARLSVLQNEGIVRSTELERLLGEKNEQIIALSIQLKDARRNADAVAQLGVRSDTVKAQTDQAITIKSTSQHDTDDTETIHICDHGEGCHPGMSRSVETTLSKCTSVKPINSCVAVVDEENQVGDNSPENAVLVRTLAVIPSDEERLIDERTSRIHADIQLLQERITKRLQQVPCVPSVDYLAPARVGKGNVAFDSDGASVSTQSESELELDRHRKATQRTKSTMSAVTSRPTVQRTSRTLAKRAGSAIADRENSLRVANRPPARVSATSTQLKPRVEPYPPHRPKLEAPTVKKKAHRRTALQPTPATR